jgi:inorganic pyrophosphatase
MKMPTAKLLIAAILDNTLNLASSNTTREDVDAFHALCAHANVGDDFRTAYFSEVQKSVETNLKNALFSDIKTVRDNPILPSRVAQLCVWNAKNVLDRLLQIREWFEPLCESWMINLIDLSENCCHFVCEDAQSQKRLESVFDIHFEAGVARTKKLYLRKQIIKKTLFESNFELGLK